MGPFSKAKMHSYPSRKEEITGFPLFLSFQSALMGIDFIAAPLALGRAISRTPSL